MNKNKNLIKRGTVWYFKKAVNGKEQRISLDTADVTLARARRDALAKKMAGSDDKWAAIDGIKGVRGVATIGEVLTRYAASTQLQLAPRTVDDNCWALRHIVRTTGNHQVETDIDTLSAGVLTGALVTSWQQAWLKEAGKDRLKMDSAAVSANSILAQARSVFSKRTTRHNIYAGMVLPDLNGFKNAPRLQELKRDDYHRPDGTLIRKLWTEAAQLRDGKSEFPMPEDVTQQSIWLAFYLVSMTGLRRGELMAMRWGWFQKNGEDASVRVKFETDFVPKGKRERVIPIMATVETECRKLALECERTMMPAECVLAGTVTVKEDIFRALGAWMKWAGWTRRQKAHELRKIFASDFLETADPYDAQLVLGHQDLKTTARYAARRAVAPVDTAARYTSAPSAPAPAPVPASL